MPMLQASLSLLVLGSLLVVVKLMALASGVVTSHNPQESWAQPSLDGWPTSCGNFSFSYPFGIGSRCSRGPDFGLTCNGTLDSPRLFMRDGITEVTDNIDVLTDGNYYGPQNFIRTSFQRTIPMESSVSVYHMSFDPPGSSFTISYYTILNITGCNLDVYLVGSNNSTTTMWVCTTVCPDQGITEMVATHNCNGFGCCRVNVAAPVSGGFHFKFVHHRHSKRNTVAHSNQTSQLWKDRISIATDGPLAFALSWDIHDQPTCVAALQNRTTYACVSKHAECVDSRTYDCIGNVNCIDGGMRSRNGYNCICGIGYAGNPYILDGCSNDKGYNPIPSRTNCTRWCGNISVPFPSGLEDGCFARGQFHLNCTNTMSSAVLQMHSYQVIDMDVSKGTIKVTLSESEQNLFVDSDLSVKWVAANLSCLEAQQNKSGYACASMNSKCVAVSTAYDYVGYQCKCSDGFQGNPYIQSGCQGNYTQSQSFSHEPSCLWLLVSIACHAWPTFSYHIASSP
uniref:Uncharacterized protein n=1 Tax=Avena sativa TaxID=4498 RepID=A0ACD5WL36_AVESA